MIDIGFPTCDSCYVRGLNQKHKLMSRLEGKAVVITGAAMSLGLAASMECAAQGATLLMVDHNEKALAMSKKNVEKAYPQVKVLGMVANVANEEQVKNYVDVAVSAFGRIDGFYNNAGNEGKQTCLPEYDLSLFKKVIDINLMSVYYGLRYVLPVMQKQGYGRIVNAASVTGIRDIMNQSTYVASKHGVAGLTKNVALEYGKNGITINAIAPGAILTPVVEESFRKMNPENPRLVEKEYARASPVKRLGLPEEVAKVVAFLLSDDCSYVNGQIIAIDGGQSNIYGNF